MSDVPEQAELEAFGETVGEAKWQAMRELERLHPGLDRDRVTFEVLAEGERGLLGVGTAPAHVLARAELPADSAADVPALRSSSEAAGSLAELARGLVAEIADEIGLDADVTVSERDDVIEVDVSARDAGLLIGRNGRTIDAVQQVLSAIVYRREGSEGRRIEVDAGGYRRRRRERVESEAQRASSRVLDTGSAVLLEPMTSLERKLVHTVLQDVEGVETRSEGEEPSRYVVVAPAAGPQAE